MITNSTYRQIRTGSSQIFIWGLRIFLLIVLISGLIHIKENPVVIIIIGFVIIAILIFYSDGEYLILQSNGIIFRKSYWIFYNIDKLYDFKDILSISFSGEYTFELDTARKMLPGYQPMKPNQIDINYNNGDLKQINLFIYKDKLIEFVDSANEILRAK